MDMGNLTRVLHLLDKTSPIKVLRNMNQLTQGFVELSLFEGFSRPIILSR